jgi:ssDNA-binding replication factor A large subunit
MIDIPFEDAVERINKETGLPVAEIQSRVQAKLDQLSGLISRNGAVHILANELGVQLVAPPPAAGAELKIKDLAPQSRNVIVNGRIVQKYEARSFNKNGREGRVASLLLGDETGVIRVTFWNDQVAAFDELQVGDVLTVKNPFAKEGYQGRLELQLNTQSSIVQNPAGVSVAARDSPRGDSPPAVQKYIKDLADTEDNVEVIATMVQVFDPRFFDACPKCNRKLVGTNQCGEHGEVVPAVNLSMSAVLDDGTGTVRTTFWKQQALRLTKLSEAEFVKFRDEPTAFEDVKTDLLGEFVKVTGKVRRNDQYERLEMTANIVQTDFDPAKEIENLQKKFDEAKKSDPARDGGAMPSPKKSSDDSGLSVVEDDVMSLDDI